MTSCPPSAGCPRPEAQAPDRFVDFPCAPRFGALLATDTGTGVPEGATRCPTIQEEVIQQMHSHYIAALVRSVVDLTEVRTS